MVRDNANTLIPRAHELHREVREINSNDVCSPHAANQSSNPFTKKTKADEDSLGSKLLQLQLMDIKDVFNNIKPQWTRTIFTLLFIHLCVCVCACIHV